MKVLTAIAVFVVLVVLASGNAFSQAESVGGPYTVDTNTVALFHFDGNTVNAAAAVGKTADSADWHTMISNGITFVPNAGVAGMGQCVRINNGAITDSSFLTLAETLAVDLTGDWTIEAWAQILTFGDNANDYRWVPRIVMKPGQDEFWHPNYWMEMWGDSRTFQTGFYTPDDQFISGTSPINMFVPGEWVHLTFIRDTQRGFIAMLVHDSNKKLKSFTARGFNPATQVPRPTLNPVHMGWAGGILNTVDKRSVDSWLDGYLDEIRISKVVRNFAGPPLVTNTTVLSNQPTTVSSYDISSTIQPFTYGNTIASSTLHYYTNKWDSVSMSGAGNVKSGSIPGQPYGALVKYYVSAIDNAGFRTTDPQNAEDAVPSVYSFYVYQPNVQTLDLTFEEGPGHAPVDHSPSNSTVVLPGRIPDYATDAPQGSYALKLVYTGWGTPAGGQVPSVDSNWVEVSSPFLSAEEFSLSAWLKPDSLIHAIRVINLPGDSTDYFNNNYEFEIRSNSAGFGWVGRYSSPDGTLYSLQDPNGIVPHKWYHLTWERRSVTVDTGIVALVVRDENNNLEWTGQITGAKPPLMGGSKTPPGARLRIGRGNPNSTDWYGFIAPFQGEIDAVTVYNYPQSGITGVGAIPSSLPGVFALDQNYPNPFNPTTKIHFEIPKAANTSLVVYDLLGRKVKTIASDYMHAGGHDVTWYGKDDRGNQVASGVYFYKLTSGTMTKTLKMMLVR